MMSKADIAAIEKVIAAIEGLQHRQGIIQACLGRHGGHISDAKSAMMRALRAAMEKRESGRQECHDEGIARGDGKAGIRTVTNHPNRKLPPACLLFLKAAVESGGDIFLDKFTHGRTARFRAGEAAILEQGGRVLQRMGLIERVLIPGTLFWCYRVTEAGRAAVGK